MWSRRGHGSVLDECERCCQVVVGPKGWEADMDMADYSEALDPAYTTLEFENMQVLPLGTGERNFETFTDLKPCSSACCDKSGV